MVASSQGRHLDQGAILFVALIGLMMATASPAMADVPLTTVSTDPYTNTSSYHQTEVEPDTFSFGSTLVATFQVGRFTNGGASNLGWATSIDNGRTWTHGFLPGTTVYASPPGPWARISDPAVAYDPEHDVWMINGLGIDNSATGKAMLVNRSTDGGLTWQNPVTASQGGAGSFYDKNWIACDTSPASPFYGNCYIEWDDAGIGGLFRMSRSTDGGLTWQPSSVPNHSVLGGQPVVQPNGTVVVPILGSGLDSYVSTDGGQTFSGPFDISSVQHHTVAGDLRVYPGLASAEVDGSGTVYVGWTDCRFRASCSANDIVFSSSTNGTAWTPVKRIPIVSASSSVDLFIPGFGVDHATAGSTAHLGVAYYFYPQASCNVDTCRLNAGFVSSADGGQTWSRQIKILGPISLRGLPDTTLGYMVGDYISTSFGSNGKAYPVVANAFGSNCVLGNVTSCDEPMVAPSRGLRVMSGIHPATTGPVLSAGDPHGKRGTPPI
jgi:hypothetical protein